MKRTAYKLKIPDYIVNIIRGIHPNLKKKIKASLQIILSDPFSGKSLKEKLEGLKSCRVSKFRIIYRISKRKKIDVVAVGPRKSIYEETFKIITRERKKTSVTKK